MTVPLRRRNRQWLLACRPSGALGLEHFAFRDVEMHEPELLPGQILVRNLVFSCAPTIRNWMNDPHRSYRASIMPGEPITGPACARVVRSANERFPAGSVLVGVSSWQDYSIMSPDLAPTPVLPVPVGLSLTDAMGVCGLNGLTAYFGLLKIGQPQRGETLVVSAAAGSVGSIAVQIGKLKGCRVIGIAGGPAKCEWLLKTCGVDAAIDYRAGNLSEALARAAPTGVDIFFDNVGGEILQITVDHMAIHGRVVLCGQVSAYNSDAPAQGPRDMMRVVYKRLLLQGFVTGDYLDEAQAARSELQRWLAEGKIVRHEDVRSGFEQLPAAFLDLFTGANAGTLLVASDEWG
jgi:NADPH-dependent curcumin reductase CurA